MSSTGSLSGEDSSSFSTMMLTKRQSVLERDSETVRRILENITISA
jgi:hypothetical protein